MEEEDDDKNSIFPTLMKMEEEESLFSGLMKMESDEEELMVKLNKALAPGHLRALVLTKFWPVFRYGVLNGYLVILLIKYSINGDASVPCGIGRH